MVQLNPLTYMGNPLNLFKKAPAESRFNVDQKTSPFVTRATNFIEKQTNSSYGLLKGVVLGETIGTLAFAADAIVHTGLALAKGTFAVGDTLVSLPKMAYNRNWKTIGAGMSHFSLKEAGVHLAKAVSCVAMIVLNIAGALVPSQMVKFNRTVGLAKEVAAKSRFQKAKDAAGNAVKLVGRGVNAACNKAVAGTKYVGKGLWNHKGKIALATTTVATASLVGASYYYGFSMDPRNYADKLPSMPSWNTLKNVWPFGASEKIEERDANSAKFCAMGWTFKNEDCVRN